jgi:hypothetical protein
MTIILQLLLEKKKMNNNFFMRDYSFCETVHVGSHSRWHIRKLSNVGQKFSGGADTPALCEAVVSWDLKTKITEISLKNACSKCLVIYREKLIVYFESFIVKKP